MEIFRNRQIIYAAIALLIVFTIDFLIPLGIAMGVLYVVCLLLVSQEDKKTIIAFAITAILLVAAKYFYFHDASTTPFALFNRIITVVAIVISSILAIRTRNLTMKLDEERRKYTSELERMLFKTTHELRRPVANCAGLMQVLDSSPTLTEEELKEIAVHLKSCSLELDKFTNELTHFLHGIKTNSKVRE